MKLAFILFTLLLLVSACSAEPKTQPIIVGEPPEPAETTEPVKDTDVIDVTGAVTKEIVDNVSNVENVSTNTNETEEGNTRTIIIQDLNFKPNKITIPIGTTVIWKHQDQNPGNENIVHMVMVYPTAKKSQRMLYGDTFDVIFDKPGRYYFIDVIFKETMRGDIVVE